MISINRHDDSAWRDTERCTEADTPDARPKLPVKEQKLRLTGVQRY